MYEKNTELFYKIKLKNDAKIFEIYDDEDLHLLPRIKNYINPFCIDFEKVSEKYDAIWLTVRGERFCRLSKPLNLFSWDCETVLILNSNCFIQL